MANTVKLKRSAVQGKVPATTDLALGELALNTYDGNLFFKRDITGSESVIRVATNTNLLSYTRVTSSATIVSRQSYIADTSAGTFVLTLPASPSSGDWVTVVDGASFLTNPLTIARNASTIESIAQDLSVNIAGVSVTLTFDGTTWQVFTQVGAQGGTEVTLSGVQTLSNKTLTSPTLSGTVAGDHSVSGIVTLNYTGAGTTSTLNLLGYNSKGGTGYHDFLKITNGYGSATNATKWLRLNSTGGLEIINSAYTAALLVLDDVGNMTLGGSLVMSSRPAFRVIGNGGAISATTTLTSSHWTLDYQQGSSLNTSTGIFTAPLAGLYSVHLVMRTNANNNSGINQAYVLKTSGGTSVVACMLEFGTNTSMNHAGVSTIIKLAANDTLKAVVTAGVLSFDSNDNWSVAFLG